MKSFDQTKLHAHDKCSHVPCGKTKLQVERLFRCSRKGCGYPYCSVECQKADWIRHKPICIRMSQMTQHHEEQAARGIADPMEIQIAMRTWMSWAAARLSFAAVAAYNFIDNPEMGKTHAILVILERTEEAKDFKKFFRVVNIGPAPIDIVAEKFLPELLPEVERQNRMAEEANLPLITHAIINCGGIFQLKPYTFTVQQFKKLHVDRQVVLNPRWQEILVRDINDGTCGDRGIYL